MSLPALPDVLVRAESALLALLTALLLTGFPGLADARQTPEIPSTTKVLTEASTIYLSISPDRSVFTFSQMTSEIEVLAPGDVIVSSISRAAPYGFLRRVVSVSVVDGHVIVATSPARLKDAIPSGRVQVSRTFSPADVETVSLAPGVTVPQPGPMTPVDLATLGFEFRGAVFYDRDLNLRTTYDQATASGRLEVSASVDFTLDLDDETASVALNLAQELELRVNSQVELATTEPARIRVARQYYAPWVIWVGPVPIVILPELTIWLGLDGRLDVGVSTGILEQGYVSAGIQYANGRIGPTGTARVDFEGLRPYGPGALQFEASAGPRLRLYLYGLSGPNIYGQIDPFMRFAVTPGAEPWWTLHAGIDVAAAAFLFGFEVAETRLRLVEELIDFAGVDPNDDTCDGPDLFVLDQQRPALWGGIGAPGDQDWASVRPRAATKMLLALSLVGPAELLKPNYDLDLWSPGCGSRIGRSSTARPAGEGCEADCQNGVGAWGDERILVDVVPHAPNAYRSRVYGHTISDYVDPDEGGPSSDYQLAASFGPMNEAFHLLSKVVDFERVTSEQAPEGVIAVTLEFQNATNAQLGNITFFLRRLSDTHRLLSARVQTKTGRRIELDVDDPAVRGPGAVVSVPNMAFCYGDVISSMCKLQEEDNINASGEYDDRFKITFRLGALVKEPLRAFETEIYATPLRSIP